MSWLAIRMLTGDRAKFFGLVFGVTFATFLMSQQVSVFVGIVGSLGKPNRRRARCQHLGDGPAGAPFRRGSGFAGERLEARARGGRGSVGGAVLQGPGSGSDREGTATQRDSRSGRRRQSGRRAAGSDRREARRSPAPLCRHRRQGGLRVPLAGRADSAGTRIRDQRSSQPCWSASAKPRRPSSPCR